jgi:hypothetical protein
VIDMVGQVRGMLGADDQHAVVMGMVSCGGVNDVKYSPTIQEI